ncbi:hypothetical protein HPP92_025694 [Vanilla planifolia]|uniref:Phosphatidylinositol N-acetylglucosaminyltransferase subunit C n=1 Tax=Vanilla planifolia TaxID=51239 RepID=A0A835PIH3_VANPL|nr:hypothetical protein HPP92_025694 [Vanilla planifolia]
MESEASKKLVQYKWSKVAYGGMQPGYDDNYTDESFLEDMVMNANVVKRDFWKVMLDSISISQYLCIVALVVVVWIQTLHSTIDETFLHYLLKVSFFISGLYILAPVYHTLTRSISSDSIWALSVSLLLVHLFLHNYSGYTIRPPGAQNNPSLSSNVSLNASIIASVLIASRLPLRLHVFAVMFFSLQVFLFSPLVTFSIRNYSFKLHLWFSFLLIFVTLSVVYSLHVMLFIILLSLLVFISIVGPYWLIRIQEYKFEIHGPWDEAKLCFDITE